MLKDALFLSKAVGEIRQRKKGVLRALWRCNTPRGMYLCILRTGLEGFGVVGENYSVVEDFAA